MDLKKKKVMQGNFFKNIMESWSKTSCTGGDGKLKICSCKCGTEFDPLGAHPQMSTTLTDMKQELSSTWV